LKSSYADTFEDKDEDKDEADSFDDRSEESAFKNPEDYLKSHLRNYYDNNMGTKVLSEFQMN
jgi:hypothetical protein